MIILAGRLFFTNYNPGWCQVIWEFQASLKMVNKIINVMNVVPKIRALMLVFMSVSVYTITQ